MFHLLFVCFGTGLAGLSAGYACLALLAVLRPRRAAVPAAFRPVSVLKPLCGPEPGLERNLRSFCQQAHPWRRRVRAALEAPLRDCVLLAEWTAAHLAAKVHWRTQTFEPDSERQVQLRARAA